MGTPLIEKPGAYPDIPIEDYHGNANLLPGPSLSASGAKTIINRSPLHFWAASPLNPNPPEREEKPHFAIGKMAHDFLLTPDRIADKYFVLPKGFNEKFTKKFAAEIEELEAARESGMTILRHQEAEVVRQVADAIGLHDVAKLAMKGGDTEVTLVWQDKETGVWLRCRPDFLPSSVLRGAPVRAVSDLKFMAPEYCSPHGFSNAIRRFGYHLAAAFYYEGIEAIYGHRPTHWTHIRISAAEVERYEKCPAEPTSPIPSNDSGEVSPSSGGSEMTATPPRNRKGTVVNSPRKIGRAPKRRPALSGKGPTIVHGPWGGS
ncbi:PD-(D/E)XK nuclease-like domain-containing protein [Sphingopyxis sp. MG]|uniref:PD-(D/E)XK nuclease-like domain-containing protein n=1 Tax=Sphingopyxis sp. MG TaxID=1866325 RepID=UPI001319BEF8|nr:PD-(D/E)XK nuclease-like domain-containing protein [Sphingopyxis sp. MG]